MTARDRVHQHSTRYPPRLPFGFKQLCVVIENSSRFLTHRNPFQRLRRQVNLIVVARLWKSRQLLDVGIQPAPDVGRRSVVGHINPTWPLLRDAEGSRPGDPASIEASSFRMSPNVFSVTITSYSRGRASRCIAVESTN